MIPDVRTLFAAGLLGAASILSATQAVAEIISADYSAPTTRYAHGVLGDAVEYGALRLGMSDGAVVTITLPQARVFEDISPRIVDVDLDGTPEIITVESDMSLGARLAIYDETGLVAATPFIGQSHRWLAPVGAADMDEDGHIEIAYVDRPHLAKTLRIWRFKQGELTQVAQQSSYSNHRIGWDFIAGGLRDCGGGPELIVATGNWSNIVSVRLTDAGRLTSTRVAEYTGPESLNASLTCP